MEGGARLGVPLSSSTVHSISVFAFIFKKKHNSWTCPRWTFSVSTRYDDWPVYLKLDNFPRSWDNFML
ncbi:hypothetical protein ES703_80578 [subsurface metagenome]